MAALAEAITMDRTTMAHNLQPLEREGLVTIKVGEADRRSRIVTLTPQGEQRVLEGKAAWQRAQAEFEAKFGADKAQNMRKMMAEVVETEVI